MTTTKPNNPTAPSRNPDALPVLQSPEETTAQATTHAILHPAALAAVTLHQWHKGVVAVDIGALVNDLRDQCGKAHGGDLARAEAMLVAQAHTLDAIFHKLALRADRVNEIPQFEAAMKMAFRAQAQCRATLETLATIKNPPNVAFVKQANIAHGPQQVNNGTNPPRAGEIQKQPNELLEHDHGQRLDCETTGAAGRGNPTLATVDTIHRPHDGRRQGRVKP